MSMETRIALVHNKIMPYREPIFERLSERYDVTFYITDETDIETEYPDLNLAEPGLASLFSELRQGDYDVIIAPEYMTAAAWVSHMGGQLSSTPVVQWTEIWDVPTKSTMSDKLNRIGIYLSSLLGTGYIVPGTAQKKYIQDTVGNTNIFTAPNATHIKQSKANSELPVSIPDSEFLILFLGQVIERKGVHTLLNAVESADLPADEVSVVIAGGGNEDYIESVTEHAKNLDPSVEVVGWVPSEQVSDYYSHADVYVLPSKHDPWAISVVEAMQAETPVIVSNAVGAAHDLVAEGETGYVTPVKNASVIAHRLETLYSDPELQQEMGLNAKERVSELATYDGMESGFVNAIEYAVRSSR